MIYVSQMYPDAAEEPIKPHPLSWMGFGFLTGAGWITQVAQGGGAGSWCLGITAVSCMIIGVWSLAKFSWTLNSRSVLIVCVGLSLFVASLFTREVQKWATVSAVLATLADVAFYEPTFEKAWHLPNEESAANFTFNSVKCVPALIALESYSISTTLYLSMLTVVNGGFAIFLIWRRRYFREQFVPDGIGALFRASRRLH
jgi:hypothetical protein